MQNGTLSRVNVDGGSQEQDRHPTGGIEVIETQLSMEAKTLRVMVVDDHPIVREGLRAVLAQDPSLALVGEAETAEQALPLLEAGDVDVVLLDIKLPGESGLDFIRKLKAMRPELIVIILTVHDSESYLVEAIRAGANGYVVKRAAHSMVLLAIQAALQGGAVVQADLLSRVVSAVPAVTGQPLRRPDLTPREREILHLLVRGNSNRQMAHELHLAEVTVKKHIQSLMAKLGASDRTQAALTAIRTGMVE